MNRQMEIKKYFKEKKEFYNHLINFLDLKGGTGLNYQNLILFEIQKIGKNRRELNEFLQIILRVSNNHYRHPDFFKKIQQLLTHIIKDIRQTFKNKEIFNIFKTNKLLLLFLIENKIIEIDKTFINLILQKSEKYLYFFYPEITPLIEEEKRKSIESDLLRLDKEMFTNFDQKRQEGQNDSYICQLIRQDMIDEFTTYTKQKKISLSSQIPHSIFESNSLLTNKEPTLIEYSAFFGSIKIFHYLMTNKVELTPSIWIFAIHGQNMDLIHLLEENKIEPEDLTYEKCLEESIKCHHNLIAKHIQDELLDKEIEKNNLKNNYDENSLSYSFHFYNYNFLPFEFNGNKFIFYYACQYNYITLVELLIQSNVMNINEPII